MHSRKRCVMLKDKDKDKLNVPSKLWTPVHSDLKRYRDFALKTFKDSLLLHGV